ncbi:MAG TPA: Ig-like domain-containing protein [Gemmatimonadales bacterium]|nr:Ig-like domain-containing protein [Gemmatimonadales bacterium]
MPYSFKISHRLSRVRAVGLLAILVVAACTSTDSSLTSPGSSQDSARNSRTVTVTPSALSGTLGQTGQLTAVVKNQYGQVMTGAIVTWASSNTLVVTVNGSGLVTAVGAGTATVTATSSGYQGTAAITVTGGTPAPTAPGTVSNLSASATTDSSVTLTFTEVNDGTGAPASYEVRFAAGTISWGSAVPPVSGTCGTPLAGTSIGNKRSCIVGGLIAGTSYQFQVVSFRGTLNQNAVFGGLSNVATAVTIAQMAVGAVTVSPSSVSGTVGQTGQFTATVTDPSGATMSGQTVNWSSSNNGVVTINASGLATAQGSGSATITAACGGKSGTAAVTVTGGGTTGQPATITISPTSSSIQVGATQLFTATVKDATGNVLTGQTVSFTSSNVLVGTVGNLTGLVTALASGSTTITATDGSLSASATLSVSATQPPPPGGWTNEPSGFTTIDDWGFDALNGSGWTTIWNDAGNGSIIADASAPASAPSVFQVMYPVGFAGGSAPATMYYDHPAAKEVFTGFWWKPSSGWQNHSSNVNKILFWFTGNSSNSIDIQMYGPAPYHLHVVQEYPSGSIRYQPNVNSTTVTLGQWHKVEWYMKYATTATSGDGIVMWWIDGVLQGSYSNIQTPDDAGFTEWKLSPTWGGVGDTKTQTDYYWFDQAHISRR